MAIEILNPGVMTTLQDVGRSGYRALGIPQSGAADRLSFALANHGVGNPWVAAALEINLGGLKVKALKPIQMVLTGAPRFAECNGQTIEQYKPFYMAEGDVLEISIGHIGARSYLAVAGGFQGQMFKGSCATYLPAAVGGLTGRALAAGDRIESGDFTATSPLPIPAAYRPLFAKNLVLRVQKGPEFDSHLCADAQRRLFTDVFIASPQTNRMGAVLSFADMDRPPLTLSNKTPLTSSPLLPGTLQVTSNGTPILSGIDSHCTGGYVRALSVIPADHWMMGQIAPGTRVSFRRERTAASEDTLRLRNHIYGQLIEGFHFDS
ncbi:MAG: biotin-dependent carboxyltransferase family protein [Maricaulaceae bacterium]